MTTNITSDYYLKPTTTKISATGDNSSLGKDAFLQILITQLQNQDPTSPMDDKEFISQMAQFSSLEQMQNMTTAMENLLSSQQETQLMSYTNFIGKDVNWIEATGELDSKGNAITNKGTSTVKELKFSKGSAVFVLEDGKEISPGNISSIKDKGSSSTTDSSNPLVAASNLIGSSVQYTSENGAIEALIESVLSTKSGIQYIMNDGTRLTKDQFKLI